MPYRPSRRTRGSALRIAQWRDRSETDLRKLGVDLGALCDLEKQLRGNAILRGAPGYDEARQEANPAFQRHPKLVVYCEVVEDVRRCLEFAHSQKLWVACRAGGHSFGGYSVNSGMVIDVSRIRYVHVLADQRVARVGAGTDFGHLNAVLDEYGLHVPGGACEDVCVAGYMQGGGYGYTSRRFGINCDNVLEFRMMLRDGRIVTANEHRNADLFWAVRGGTGGNFGVLLEIAYRLYELGPVTGFAWAWDIDDAPALLTCLQRDFMRSGASPQLGYMACLAVHETRRVLALQAIYTGAAAEGRSELASLRDVAEPIREVERTGPYYRINEWVNENPWPLPNLPDTGVSEGKQAGYIDRPLSHDDWQLVVDFYNTSSNAFNTVVIEPYGGAINDHPEFGNAFVHRDIDMDFFVDVFWTRDDERAEAIAWLDEFMGLMAPYFNGHVYQNYPRDTLPDYRHMYFGAAFDALLKIKNKYDPPPYFFDYQQAIKPYRDDEPATARRPGIAAPFADQPIVYDD
jgi:FAD/FMN-containing dehydrogenase